MIKIIYSDIIKKNKKKGVFLDKETMQKIGYLEGLMYKRPLEICAFTLTSKMVDLKKYPDLSLLHREILQLEKKFPRDRYLLRLNDKFELKIKFSAEPKFEKSFSGTIRDASWYNLLTEIFSDESELYAFRNDYDINDFFKLYEISARRKRSVLTDTQFLEIYSSIIKRDEYALKVISNPANDNQTYSSWLFNATKDLREISVYGMDVKLLQKEYDLLFDKKLLNKEAIVERIQTLGRSGELRNFGISQHVDYLLDLVEINEGLVTKRIEAPNTLRDLITCPNSTAFRKIFKKTDNTDLELEF